MRIGYLWLALYVLCIFGANWALHTFGIVPIGFGLSAPAGVFFVGLVLVLRDGVQNSLGRWWGIAAIPIGAALSALVDPHFAGASGLTFLLSESADALVFSPLRRRHLVLGVWLSSTVGDVVDSIVFLTLAFGSLEFLAGQILGKEMMVAAATLVLWIVRQRRQSAVFERRSAA